MTCPHCHAGFLPDGARRCPLCGQLRSGPQKAVSVEVPPDDNYGAVDEIVRADLGSQFRIERPLKHGRASHVYLVHDASRRGGREAALKVVVLPPGVTSTDTARFQVAAHTAAGLDHPHIAQPYRHGTTEALWWCAMDYVPAPSLAERLAAGLGHPLDVPLTWRIALQVASALDYAHRRGIVHGALNPSDVLLDDAGWVRVVDTGLAAATRTAAETGDEPIGPLADQYSLAVIVRTCLTGEPPRGGAVPLAGLPPEAGARAAQALQRALAQAPGHRFAGVVDFVAALTGGAPQTPLGFSPRSPARGAPRPVLLFDPEDAPPPRRRVYRLGVALAIAVSMGALWLAAQAGTHNRVEPIRPPEPVVLAPKPAPLLVPQEAPLAPAPSPAPPPAPTRTAVVPPRRRPVPAVREPGYLSVSSRPWALLSIDGRLIGNTPRINVRLPAGVHQLRLQRAGFRTYEAAVEVKPGETLSITGVTLTETAR